jgi:hypothetical protein
MSVPALKRIYQYSTVNIHITEALAKLLQDDSPSLYGRTLWGLKGLGGWAKLQHADLTANSPPPEPSPQGREGSFWTFARASHIMK